LTDGEMAGVLQTAGLVPSSHSPLAGLGLESMDASPVAPAGIDARLHRAIEWVAQPYLAIGLMLSPPYDDASRWFYRGLGAQAEPAFVAHRQQRAGVHELAWATEDDVTAPVRACLRLDVPIEPSGVSLDVSLGTYETFLGVVDADRERVLRALVDRSAGAERQFTAAFVADAFTRSHDGNDIRWLVAAAQALSPFEFRLTEAECARGLGDLAAAGLLTRQGDAWAPTPAMQAICASLGALQAFCGFHRSRVVSGGRDEQHDVIVLAGSGSRWLIEFDGVASATPRVRLRAASAEDIELMVATTLRGWPDAPRAAAATPATACLACGKSLDADWKACPWCGTTRAPVAAALVSSPEPRVKSGAWFKTGRSRIAFVDPVHVRDLARVLREVRDRKLLPADEFKALHAALVVKGPGGAPWNADVWTVGLGSLEWSRRQDGEWQRTDPPPTVWLDTELLRAAARAMPASGDSRIVHVGGDAVPTPGERRCPRCQRVVPAENQFCIHDGTRVPFERRCPRCRQLVPSGNSFCIHDGTRVA
jgi:RNA polymerase subunit RPABC4/transcription elongation factor Spt4